MTAFWLLWCQNKMCYPSTAAIYYSTHVVKLLRWWICVIIYVLNSCSAHYKFVRILKECVASFNFQAVLIVMSKHKETRMGAMSNNKSVEHKHDDLIVFVQLFFMAVVLATLHFLQLFEFNCGIIVSILCGWRSTHEINRKN